ncbi:MAG: HTTM domain-containing protein [Planctomycetota bacterium]
MAKISADWLAGEPVRMWVRGNAIGKYLAHFLSPSQMQSVQEILRSEAIVWLLVYGGLIFDLAIGFLLIFRRTRLFGLTLVVAFHGVNFFLFNIGVFPALATASTLIFLEPDWPDRFWAWLRKPRVREPDWPWFLGGLLLFPPFGAALGWKLAPAAGADASSTGSEQGRGEWWVLPFVVGWTVVQFIVPLRHYAIPGNVLWTDEGSNFAWLMMLRNKEGSAQFFVVDPALDSHVDPVSPFREFGKTEKLPFLEYQFVDTASLDWSKLPEFLVIREPLAGERIVFNRAANGHLSYEESVVRIRDYWIRTYGRRPAVAQPRRLSEVLHDLATKIATTSRAGNDQAIPPLLQHIAMALSAANQLTQKYEHGSGDFQLNMSLQLSLAHARDADGSNRILRNSFGTISPFSMQGNPSSVAPVLLIEDKELLRPLPRTGTVMNWDAWKGPRREYLDLERTEPLFLRPLPLLIVGRDSSGEMKVAWNYARDLTEFQLRAMRCFPYLQYKYVQRIAGWWEEQFQRRPRVYVMSLQQLNHHPMQPAIDPTVDLASQEYRILDHNSWYLPLRRHEEWHEKLE